jgi:hypothetical protein
MISEKQLRAIMKMISVWHLLQQKGFEVTGVGRTGDDYGWRIDLRCGQNINIFDSGALVVQGKRRREVELLLHRFDETRLIDHWIKKLSRPLFPEDYEAA